MGNEWDPWQKCFKISVSENTQQWKTVWLVSSIRTLDEGKEHHFGVELQPGSMGSMWSDTICNKASDWLIYVLLSTGDFYHNSLNFISVAMATQHGANSSEHIWLCLISINSTETCKVPGPASTVSLAGKLLRGKENYLHMNLKINKWIHSAKQKDHHASNMRNIFNNVAAIRLIRQFPGGSFTKSMLECGDRNSAGSRADEFP